MLRGIIGTSTQFRYLIVVLAAVLLIVGLLQLRAMPVDVLPEFSLPYVEIQTEALGLSAEEVEQMITVPMEQDLLAGVAWADVIRSESVPGLSSVVVYFEPGTDLFKARQMVSERLAQAAVGLPHVSKPPTMIQPLSSSSRFLIIGLSSQDQSLIEMSVLARWVIAPRLLGVPGVANVATWGQRERQLQVLVDPERLRAQGVSLEQVIETTGNALWVSSLTFLEASSPGTGGFIDTPNQRLGVWHVLPISSPDDLGQVPVVAQEGGILRQAGGTGAPLVLSDVADLAEDHQPLIGDAVVNGDPNLLLVIEKLPGANTLEVTRGVEAALEALRPGLAGIRFDATLFRPATFIETALANLSRTGLIAAVLLVLVFSVFLYGWRAALISLIAIPLSLVAALLVLYWQGATLNAVLLSGLVIALGIVIDDAAVDVEHLRQRLREARLAAHPPSAASLIGEAAAETRGALVFAMLVVGLAILPVFFLEGEPGALFRSLAVAYALAVLASMVVALTVTPALSLILLPDEAGGPAPARPAPESPVAGWLQRAYLPALAPIIRRPYPVLGAVALLVVAGLAAAFFIKPSRLFPAFQEPYLLIRLEGVPGASHTAMDRIVARASAELRAIPGVENVGAHVGRAVFGDQVVGINSAQVWIKIAPQADYAATTAAVREAIEGYPGLKPEVTTFLQEALGPASASAGGVYTVRVYGEDLDVLRAEAEKIRQALAGVGGVANPQVAYPPEESTLEIEVDLAAAQTYGIKPGDVRRQAAVLLSGLQVGALFEEQKVFEVVVWGAPGVRESLSRIRELLVETPGGHVRLGEVAKVRIVPAPSVIRREAISPYLDITFTVPGRAAPVLSEIETLLRNFAFPLEYRAVLKNQAAAQAAVQQRVLLAALIAAVGIFLLLQAAYGSWRLAGIAILTLPGALAGGGLAALLGGITSYSSLFGLLAVLGLVVRNGILMTSHLQRLERQAGQVFGPELVLRGAQDRLGPVLMSALATGLALLPFLFFGDIPGHEVVRPLALVIIGGLVTATAFDLLAMPALHVRFGARRETEALGLAFSPQPEFGSPAD